MSKSKKTDPVDAVKFIMEMAKHQNGVACSKVDDGYIIVFSKEMLENLLKQTEEKNTDKIVVFIKQSEHSS